MLLNFKEFSNDELNNFKNNLIHYNISHQLFVFDNIKIINDIYYDKDSTRSKNEDKLLDIGLLSISNEMKMIPKDTVCSIDFRYANNFIVTIQNYKVKINYDILSQLCLDIQLTDTGKKCLQYNKDIKKIFESYYNLHKNFDKKTLP